MSMILIATLLAGLLIVGPLALQLYLHRLPPAPSCPSCRATTHEAGGGSWLALELLPALVVTYVGECARCGWKGRLRLRWATDKVRRGDD